MEPCVACERESIEYDYVNWDHEDYYEEEDYRFPWVIESRDLGDDYKPREDEITDADILRDSEYVPYDSQCLLRIRNMIHQ